MRVLVIGGTGFIGRQIVGRLVAQGHVVQVPTRHFAHGRDLLVYPLVTEFEADVNDEQTLQRMVAGSDAVNNLVGILHSRPGRPYGSDFDRAHVQLPRRIAQACRQQGVKRLLHMSALGANAQGPSGYLRSKAAGEQAIREVFESWPEGAYTLFRASVVFGPDDQFLNMFARLARLFPVLPMAGASARMQPVFVGDVAAAITNALENPRTFGKTYDLAGSRVYTLGELVKLAAGWAGAPRPVLEMPQVIGRMQAMFFECMPGVPLMSRDNLDSLSVDNVSEGAMDAELGVVATPLESVAPVYLARTASADERH